MNNFAQVMDSITINHEAYMKDVVLPVTPELRPQTIGIK